MCLFFKKSYFKVCRKKVRFYSSNFEIKTEHLDLEWKICKDKVHVLLGYVPYKKYIYFDNYDSIGLGKFLWLPYIDLPDMIARERILLHCCIASKDKSILVFNRSLIDIHDGWIIWNKEIKYTVFYDRNINTFFTFSNANFEYYLYICPLLNDSLFYVSYYYDQRKWSSIFLPWSFE